MDEWMNEWIANNKMSNKQPSMMAFVPRSVTSRPSKFNINYSFCCDDFVNNSFVLKFNVDLIDLGK